MEEVEETIVRRLGGRYGLARRLHWGAV